MSRYIDADLLKDKTTRVNNIWNVTTNAEGKGLDEIIDDIPTADVVPMDFHDRCMEIEIQKRMNMVKVVRCKDCKHWKNDHLCQAWSRYGTIETKADQYCSYGER